MYMHTPVYTHTHIYNYTVYIFGTFWVWLRYGVLFDYIVKVVLSLDFVVTFCG